MQTTKYICSILALVILISFFILYPPGSYFKSIFRSGKIRWFNIVLFGVGIGIIVTGVYSKIGEHMKNYPKCA